ncbi:MAG: S8 family serine peptidase, partial [Candidatus Doudnabacteria bacterium]|nr:S8 family serine peptidase [Candidatus Doudnabacteria bacterium]
MVDAYDPGFTNNPQNVDRSWALPRIGAPDAWNFTTGSSQIVVALVDTGVDQTHEDLRKTLFVTGYDFLLNRDIVPGTDSDDNGHGTLVAGVLAATPNNGLGITGVVWSVGVMPLKALNAEGEGSSENVAKAIRYATDHGASIINLSLGGVGFGQDVGLANAIRYAYGHNVLVIAAAGNDLAAQGVDLDTEPVFPICDDNAQNMVLGVAAVDASDQKPSFSNFGKSCVDVSAPGKRILSTIGRNPVTRARSPDTYAYASGTSLAVPFVSGQAALLRALYPDATNRQIRDRIINTTDSVDTVNMYQCGGNSCAGKLGTGRINILRSLQSKISKEGLQEGDVVRLQETGELFVLLGGRRERLSNLVLQQRYTNVAH